MDKPIVLFTHTLKWECEPNEPNHTFRFIARPTEYGFNGIEYIIEVHSGFDALNKVIWLPLKATSTSLFQAAIGQYLLENYDKLAK